MLAQTLTDVGLSPTESKIYLSLVTSGPNPATLISKETGIHRANVYSSLYRLSEKGLVSHSKLDKHVIFSANNPNILLSLLKEKETSLRTVLSDLVLKSTLNQSLDVEVISGLSAFSQSLFSFDNNKEVVFIGSENNLPIGLSAKLSLFLSQYGNVISKNSSSRVLLFSQDGLTLIHFPNNSKTIRIRSNDFADLFSLLF